MLIGILLLIIFLVWACAIWRSAPPLITESELASEVFRYRHATTPWRRWSIALGSCLLFAALFSFVTYSVAYLVWSSFLFNWIDANGLIKLLWFLAVTAAVVALSGVPKIRQFLVDACQFFQRYQFFPPLPSRKEGDLMRQLERLPAGTLPGEVESVLAAGATSGHHNEEIYYTYRRLQHVHAELEKIASGHRGVVKILYFGGEWELVDSQYQAVRKQMYSHGGEVDSILIGKMCTCLYYACCLLSRYVMETSTSSEEMRRKFRSMGFDLAV